MGDGGVDVGDLAFGVLPVAWLTLALPKSPKVERQTTDPRSREPSSVEVGLLFLAGGPGAGHDDNRDRRAHV